MASGGSAVSIGWDPITDQDGNKIFYKVFLLGTGASCNDLGPISAGDGGTATANTIPAGAIQLGNDTQAGATSTTVNPSGFGVPVGGAGLVTVVAVDFAGNEGTFSDTKCVVYVQTAGFCDVYGTMGGDCDAGGCSVSMPGPGAGRAAPLGLLALGVLVVAARRRRFGA
jgi:MYXO-CTERM domain-containing protein